MNASLEFTACSFCGLSTSKMQYLPSATGTSHRVCDACIDRCLDVLDAKPESDASIRADLARATDPIARRALGRVLEDNPLLDKPIACSFCARVVAERRKIVAAPTLYICDACIHAAAATR